MSAPSSQRPKSFRAAFLALHIPGFEVQHYELTEKITSVGRSKNNVLEIPDTNMSRRHFIIERRDDGQCIVTDCNSSNGTLVNSERVISVALEDKDWIEVGSTRIQFLSSELEHVGANSQQIDSVQAQENSELGVVLGEREDLKRLLAINKELNQEHELRPLLERIIDSAIELMAAERGYLILAGRADMKIEIARGLGTGRRGTTVSKQICNEVMDTGRVILTTNAAEDSNYGRFESVVEHNIRSILCVPFTIKNTVLGVIYLDNEKVGAFSAHDVELLEAFSDQAAVAIDNARLIHGMKKKERLEQEMKTAAEIQAKLLPRVVPNVSGLDLAGYMRSAKEVGGDYYDFVELEDTNTVLICIGDVSGKGVPAGLIMASARSMIRALAGRIASTKELLVDLNRIMSQDLEMDMFMSMLLIRYNAKTRQMSYTGAGHEHLVIYRATTKKCETRKAGGVVLGVTPDLTNYVQERSLNLAPGDAVILYTDGVTEAFNKHQQEYQLERFVESCERHGDKNSKLLLESLMRDLMSFVGKTPQSDDVTIVVLKKT